MSRKPNLAAIVEAAGSTRRQRVPEPAEVRRTRSEVTPAKAKTRQATRQIAGHFPEAVAWQLRELAVERRSTVQALMAEALNDLFQKHGKPEIAPTGQGRAT
jgi:hypothetical protein